MKVCSNATAGSAGTEGDTEGEGMPLGSADAPADEAGKPVMGSTAKLLALAGTEASAGGATFGF
ncbi:hypothetical protein GCM10011374_41520 [Kocuria dechangensis]|uniref:Uncharacterized protein n=1 Tax=Kocuria dechangensis TaxID=1176249 RepID=A0A917M156_9MICC|nr:hypothetical protein GCM10011374_41520 [Kocuria dechangensis]